MFLMITFCDNSPIVDDYWECKNDITGCYYDDIFTIEDCIEEYRYDFGVTPNDRSK